MITCLGACFVYFLVKNGDGTSWTALPAGALYFFVTANVEMTLCVYLRCLILKLCVFIVKNDDQLYGETCATASTENTCAFKFICTNS